MTPVTPEKKPCNEHSIAIIGGRGISNYGGFETYVSELGPFLHDRGFLVYGSCEIPQTGELQKNYKGMDLLYFPIRPPKQYLLRKMFEMVYDAYFIIRCSFFCENILVLGLGGHVFLLFPRLLRRKVIINFGGLEWERSKFSPFERKMMKFFFRVSVGLSHAIIIDNERLIDVIPGNYQGKAVFLPYWVEEPVSVPWNVNHLKPFSISSAVEKKDFWLTVARLQPDNNIEMIIEGFINSGSEKPFLMVGNFMDPQYKNRIATKFGKALNKVTFLGAIHDQEILNMLRQNCFAYIHGHQMGGTNPALLEAMMMKNLILAHDNVFNRSVCQDTVVYFSSADALRDLISDLEKRPGDYSSLITAAYHRVKANYHSSVIMDRYQQFLCKPV
jgi:rhamnosyltransferase